MASTIYAVKNTAYTLRISLQDFAVPGSFKSNPTIATGDWKVDIDGGGFNNLASNPACSPAASLSLQISLTAAEMNGDSIFITGVDQSSPKEWADFAIEIKTYPIQQAALFAPRIAAALTATQFGSDATSHAVSMPSTVLLGDLLLCFFTNDGNDAITTPSGWTVKDSSANSTIVRLAIYAKKADGTEGGTTVDFVTAGAQRAAAQVYRIPRGEWSGDIADVVVGTAATGTSVSPNPPSLTPRWGQLDTLFFAVSGNQDGTHTTSAYPTGYSGGTSTVSDANSTGVNLSSAYRPALGAAEDPGVFTITSDDWVAQTVAVRGQIPGSYTDIDTDTYTELGQGAPPATASIRKMIAYLYKSWRNKKEQTSTTFKLYDDAGTTVDQKATVSDDETTFTGGEIVSGP